MLDRIRLRIRVIQTQGFLHIRGTQDPSVSMESYMIQFGESDITLPKQPLLTMDLNRIYPVDIYFYLEGCDPDCSDDLSFDIADLHLAFYGVLQQEEAG